MNNNYIDLMGIEEKYPNLKYDDKKNILTGTINICKKCNDEIIRKSYDLLIDFNKSSVPYVYDIGKKIKKNYEHKYVDSRLCLATDVEQFIFLQKEQKISLWIEHFVEPYFISYEYYQLYGIYPFGSYSHGKKGIIEFYEQYFNLENEKNSLDIIKYILLKKYRGHDLCPCGSNQKIRKCHKNFILACKNDPNILTLEKYFRRDFGEKN